MQRSQQYPAYEPKPPVASLDFSDHLRQQYLNCENSLNIFQATSAEGIFISQIPLERFSENVRILHATILGSPTLKEDQQFKKDTAPFKENMKGRFSGEDFQPCEHTLVYSSCGCSQSEVLKEKTALELWTAITSLFHRMKIFKEPVSVYGGHI